MKKSSSLVSIPLQPASEDIWNTKYRLRDLNGNAIDETVEDTQKRVAKALADCEASKDLKKHWYERFLWAQQMGAIPAGRITSNAGAQEYKPETSLINCTVSAHIQDSMNEILAKSHEAGLTLKAGCGIGYSFSTLRPRGAFVAGAGAYTSGPLSFMDIYDKICFTVASAGGRRGAQMGTFDISHPDVRDFIRVKREDGRLRQFNLSLLISEAFMEAVEENKDWELVFPVHKKELEKLDLNDRSQVVWREWPIHEGYQVREDGLVACRIYKTISARHLWDMIMSSTYDFAEPGFILIDKVNQMNNNWWCENIQATNPCVVGETRLATQYGMVKIEDLYNQGVPLKATVDTRTLSDGGKKGVVIRDAKPAFMTAPKASVFHVVTEAGYEIKATEWHDFYTERGKLKLRDLTTDDNLLIQSGKGQFGSEGTKELGMLLGLISGDGHFTNRGKNTEAAVVSLWGEEKELAPIIVNYVNDEISKEQHKWQKVSAVEVADRNMVFIRSVVLARLLEKYSFNRSTKLKVPEVIWKGTEDCVRSYLSALFQADGTINASNDGCSIRLSSSVEEFLKEIQVLLSNFGIFSSVYKRRKEQVKNMPDGNGGFKSYPCASQFELIIDGESRECFMSEIGFLLSIKNDKYHDWAKDKKLNKTQRFVSRIASIEYIGEYPVYDTTQPDHNSVIFNGMVTGQCGEQPLPPYGSCLLGSINLTKFVKDPFTDKASFDWETYAEVVRVFTRMLDNVVELNGLPLERQREEIFSKRRHGMGFLGLGSMLTMLKVPYGSQESVSMTEKITKIMAIEGWKVSLELAKEKGPAPLLEQTFTVTKEMLRKRPEMVKDGHKEGDSIKGAELHARYSRYMQKIAEVEPELVEQLAQVGARFTHHTSIAPTGTISLSLANNASNGIEPSFAHHYSRNIIREGKKSKEKVEVYSFELLAYRELINSDAMPYTNDEKARLPNYFVSADDISPKEHVDIQAAAQIWVDSSISKTANVPTDFPYEQFKDIYMYAYKQGLKGCTTFRFNPEAFQGVLVKEEDLENTIYKFTLADGTVASFKGNESVEYDGEVHTAANLYDALKEGYYGKF